MNINLSYIYNIVQLFINHLFEPLCSCHCGGSISQMKAYEVYLHDACIHLWGIKRSWNSISRWFRNSWCWVSVSYKTDNQHAQELNSLKFYQNVNFVCSLRTFRHQNKLNSGDDIIVRSSDCAINLFLQSSNKQGYSYSVSHSVIDWQFFKMTNNILFFT